MSAEILMPRAAVVGHELAYNRDTQSIWTDEDIRIMAREFNVSDEALLRRLATLGRTSDAFYRQKRAVYLALYEKAEARRLERRRKVIVPPYRKALKQHGVPFVKAVLSALSERRVTVSEASGYLGLRVKHLGSLENAVFRPR